MHSFNAIRAFCSGFPNRSLWYDHPVVGLWTGLSSRMLICLKLRTSLRFVLINGTPDLSRWKVAMANCGLPLFGACVNTAVINTDLLALVNIFHCLHFHIHSHSDFFFSYFKRCFAFLCYFHGAFHFLLLFMVFIFSAVCAFLFLFPHLFRVSFFFRSFFLLLFRVTLLFFLPSLD
jgi:hypothetical protein